MAELADAADSKSAGLRPLGVRLPLPAPKILKKLSSFPGKDECTTCSASVRKVCAKLLGEEASFLDSRTGVVFGSGE